MTDRSKVKIQTVFVECPDTDTAVVTTVISNADAETRSSVRLLVESMIGKLEDVGMTVNEVLTA